MSFGVMKKKTFHGDWKTDAIRPRPPLEKGDRVKVIKEWVNFYGRWLKVESTDGITYDVPPDSLALEPKCP